MIFKRIKRFSLISSTFCFLYIISMILYTNNTAHLDLQERLNGPLSPFDENLLKITLEKYLYPPSSHPYNLMLTKSETSKKTFVQFRKDNKSWNTLYETLKMLYPINSGPGFFVEAGAFDGEHFSNTLYLELKLGWEGLLVEPSKVNVRSILAKNRKAWVSPCCLATKPYPHKTFLQLLVSNSIRYAAMNSLVESKTTFERTKYSNFYYQEVQCLPLQTLIKALNRTHVDVVSLDVEDVEVEVLKSFAWNEVSVDVWLVEHRHPENKFLVTDDKEDPEFIKWFNEKGYIVYKIAVDPLTDYVFLKKDTDFYRRNKNRLKLI